MDQRLAGSRFTIRELMPTAHKYARIESERRFLLRSLPLDLDVQVALLANWLGEK